MTRWAKSSACTLLLAGSATAVAPGAPNGFTLTEKSFHGMTQMTRVGHFYVDNLAGNLKGTVQVAQSGMPGIYPVGSVLQLVPTEVMVKREKGFNAATRDWEFFELDVSKDGSKIRTRGLWKSTTASAATASAVTSRPAPSGTWSATLTMVAIPFRSPAT